ncbi:MAG: hypothetical protein FVQ78_03250 [Solirubrobacterales bacterium]|nr:hypothetical protein [Solirubrobacterales bacterium]
MKLFSFDPADHRDHYAQNGWAHIKGGVSPEFLDALRAFADESFRVHEVEGKAIAGRKTQALYEAPEGVDFPGELFDVIAEICGLHRPTMTLSERHIKAYDEDAPPEPIPHKDRYASQVSIGLSIVVPDDSRLTLYPREELDVNPLNVSAAYLEGLAPERRPEEALRGIEPVELYDEPGDVMMFAGNAVWHARRKPAGATNLYLKLNDFNCDPLGEDPASAGLRQASVEAAENGDLRERVPILGRRLDCVSRRYTRDWSEAAQAEMWEDSPVALSAGDLELLEAVDGRKTAAEVLSAISGEDGSEALRRLARRGVLDLL